MNPSLTVLVPVTNAQASIERLVLEMLDLLPELTPRFSLLLINHGSSDDTASLADELAREYPQLRVISPVTHLPRAEVLATALRRTSHDWLLLREQNCALDARELDRLWKNAQRYDVVLGVPRSGMPAGRAWYQLTADWSSRPRSDREPGFQLVRREAATGGWMTQERGAWLAGLPKSGLRWTQVEMRQRVLSTPTTSADASQTRWRSDRANPQSRPTSGPAYSRERSETAAPAMLWGG